MPSFNLIDEPWIPCIPRSGGEPVPLGLEEVLVQAHQHRELMDNSPLVTVALHRLLLAVIHRALGGPRTSKAWREWWAQGQLDPRRIASYLERCRPSFDLFDAQRPFYQVPWMAGVNTIAAAKLAHERASGNNITLFDHTTAATGALTPAQAARYLVAFQAFAIGGGVSQPFNLSDAPLAREYTVLVRGQTLFETLLLNLVRYTAHAPVPWVRDDDPPCWEHPEAREPQQEGTAPNGYLDYLTWQSRRVHLIYDEMTGLVSTCQIRQNLRLAPAPLVFDPFKLYRLTKQNTWYAARLSDNKAVWRDVPSMLEMADDTMEPRTKRPAVFDWLTEVLPFDQGHRPGTARPYAVDVLGYLNEGNQATIVLWRHEHLPLPLRYLTDRELRGQLGSALALAEEVSHLFQARFSRGQAQRHYPRPLWLLADELLTATSRRTAEQEEIDGLVAHLGAERAYWAALELHFRHFVVQLAEEAEAVGEEGRDRTVLADVLSDWASHVETCARQTMRTLTRSLDTRARSLRAATLAERVFNWQLNDMLAAFRRDHGLSEPEEVQG